jgi:nitroreductase
MENDTNDHNLIFDDIVRSRRSIRVFKDDKPPKTNIEDIIEAGMLAPYAAAAVRDSKDFRHFYVFEKGTESIETLALLMENKASEGVKHFEGIIKEKPYMKPKLQPFLNRLKMISEKGVPGVTTAPFFIIAAELRGIPPAEQESLAHVLENMWLKTTALNLGFQLISLTSQMAEDELLMKVLELPVGKYALNGCAIGYPGIIPNPTPRPNTKKATKWMK